MQRLEVSTVVYVAREEVYEFLIELPRYAQYSEYLEAVQQYGDGSPGTEYDLQLAWWKLRYTARSEVTDVTPPERIDWELCRDLDASGYWAVESEPAPADHDHASRVHFVVEYAPDTARADAVDLPSLVSFDWVIEKVTPKLRSEAEQVIRRVVRDLEGEPRRASLTVHETPDL